jgi:hypothetical protein
MGWASPAIVALSHRAGLAGFVIYELRIAAAPRPTCACSGGALAAIGFVAYQDLSDSHRMISYPSPYVQNTTPGQAGLRFLPLSPVSSRSPS